MQKSVDEIHANKHWLKIFPLIFHFITGYFILKLIKRHQSTDENTLFNVLFYLLNIAVLYNAIIWNQVDIILACFVFLSVYYAFGKKPLMSLVFLILALNFKLHAVIFIPVIALLLLPGMVIKFSFKKFLVGFIILSVLQILILLPFILTRSIENLPWVITHSFGKFPVISAYAYNVWHLLVMGPLTKMHDTRIFAGLSYNQWGLLLFMFSSTIALLPLLKNVYHSFKRQKVPEITLEQILIIAGLIPLVFFYFNTQMHERYSHPSLVFVITYGIIRKNPLLPIIVSLAYFLNLEDELHFLELNSYGTVIFDSQVISTLYLITIVGLFYELYRPAPVQKSERGS